MSKAAIVTGTDGSDSATAAARQAAALAGSSGVALHMVSAYRDGTPQEAVATILATARTALAGLDVEVHLHAEQGDPAGALCAVAARAWCCSTASGTPRTSRSRPSSASGLRAGFVRRRRQQLR